MIVVILSINVMYLTTNQSDIQLIKKNITITLDGNIIDTFKNAV